MKMTALVKTVATMSLATAAFLRFVRPWYLRWGATDEDVARAIPLDERVPTPRLNSSMAVEVKATPAQIWPWLAQIGEPPRGGYYSYTFIERMVGLHVKNAGVILPEFQTLDVGEAVDKAGTMVVQAVEPEHYLVLGPPESVDYIKCVWTLAIYPVDQATSRLVARVRASWSYRRMLPQSTVLALPLYLLIEPGAFIMQRKMLLEIKRLAEGLAKQQAAARVAAA
jgi:hypothetical protein